MFLHVMVLEAVQYKRLIFLVFSNKMEQITTLETVFKQQ